MRTRTKSGFTLVEILIVVVILGILAAIVIPQFSQASTDAKTSSLQSNLQTMRSQLALYKIQHNDTVPLTAAAAGTGLQTLLINKTTIAGVVDAAGACGPYLQVKIPNNPFTGANAVGTDWIYTSDGSTWSFTAPAPYAAY